MVTATVFLFSVLPLACGSLISIVSRFFASVDAIMKKISKRKTISVIEDILNSGVILFLPFKFMLSRFVE